ncbi:MAG: pyridoxamine 5'-phosphate oxidase family protein [Gammaproteobacteria bacterium]|nr:pyridoxamine 5'-phosphate oxidase family protein [Gammaproteobacteria bacterium]
MKLSKEIDELLKQTQICVLATTGPGDWPHAIPMWYRYDDGVITITTSSRSQKCKNVERTGKAMVVLDKREPPYHAVMIKGEAEVGPGFSREEEYEVALRYLGPDRVDNFMAIYDAGDHDDATIIIRPKKVFEFRGG